MNSHFQEPLQRNMLVLVDHDDNQVGLIDKLEAHQGQAILHRAISVVLHDGQGRLLLQQRSKDKPLWPLFWSNTCCTHPFEGESYQSCAVRRLKEEMGVMMPELKLEILYRFQYQAIYNNYFAEHELDTVLIGNYQGPVQPIPEEVAGHKWISWPDLKQDIKLHPDSYTPWFKLMVSDGRVENQISSE